MHEMQTIVTDVRGVCLSVCLYVTRLNSVARAVCVGSFDAAFAKLLWPLVGVWPRTVGETSVLPCEPMWLGNNYFHLH